MLASDEEGLGLVLLEGTACGLPSIDSNCSGIREVIRDGETGLLFAPGDAASLAQRIVDLAMNAERRIAMGRAGRGCVEEHFNEEHYAAKITAVIDELVAVSGTR